MSQPKIRILCVSHPDSRFGQFGESVKTLLEDDPEFEFVGNVTSSRKAVGEVVRLRPDVVIIGTSPGIGFLSAPQLCGLIKEIDPGIVCIGSTNGELVLLRELLMMGASDVLFLPLDKEEVVRSLHLALQNRMIHQPVSPIAEDLIRRTEKIREFESQHNPNYRNFYWSTPVLVGIFGLPGTGKTTVADYLRNNHPLSHFSTDEIRIRYGLESGTEALKTMQEAAQFLGGGLILMASVHKNRSGMRCVSLPNRKGRVSFRFIPPLPVNRLKTVWPNVGPTHN
jgi:DNA-binding NarL/FixJ family response regulator